MSPQTLDSNNGCAFCTLPCNRPTGAWTCPYCQQVWQSGAEPDDANRVSPDCRCPTCGEDHTDLLIWIDDDQVRCFRCGTVYDPSRHPDANA